MKRTYTEITQQIGLEQSALIALQKQLSRTNTSEHHKNVTVGLMSKIRTTITRLKLKQRRMEEQGNNTIEVLEENIIIN